MKQWILIKETLKVKILIGEYKTYQEAIEAKEKIIYDPKSWDDYYIAKVYTKKEKKERLK